LNLYNTYFAPYWRRLPKWARIAAGVVIGLLIVWWLIPGGTSDIPTATVAKGEFVVDLKETGELRAENSITISSPPVRSNLQITNLVAEGTVVKAGDFLLQFDGTELRQQIEDKQADLDIARSNLKSSLASMDSRIQSLGSGVENSQASLRLAELRLDQMKFEADVQVEEGRLNLKQAQISLAQAQQQLAAQRTIDSAEVRSLELKIHQAEIDLQKTKSELERLTITAPGPGLAVYKETWKGGEMAKVKVGDTPWRGMALLEIPDLSVMMVKTTVSEVDVARVKVGLEAEVKLDAYPEPTFHGKVAEVGVLASTEEGNEDAKVFDVLIRINESDALLRPGMSATVRIFIDRLPDKLWAPIEAVFDRGDKYLAYEMSGSGWKEREVKLGARNDNYVVIDSGLQPGVKVALVDPTLEQTKQPKVNQQKQTEKSRSTSRATTPESRPTTRGRRVIIH
jgi:RND family efflux transporter MFP subunit